MHTIRDQYNLSSCNDGLESDYKAMLAWLYSHNVSPCTSAYFGADINAILVSKWIAYRDSLSNRLGLYDREHLEQLALENCEPEDFYELLDCLEETCDGHLMAIGQLFCSDPKLLDIELPQQ